MLILAIDTSAKVVSAAVCEWDGRGIARYSLASLNNGLTHSETLFPLIDAALGGFGKSIGDVELFAVTAGPGSFTGVRIGVSAVKGLAFDGRPVAAVSALEALAQNLGAEGVVCPLMDARRQAFYCAFFERKGGVLRRLTPDRALSLEELSAEAEGYGKVQVCGDGAELFASLYAGSAEVVRPSLCERDQNALSVALCGALLYGRGEACTADSLPVFYLRKPQAEREREARLKKERGIRSEEA